MITLLWRRVCASAVREIEVIFIDKNSFSILNFWNCTMGGLQHTFCFGKCVNVMKFKASYPFFRYCVLLIDCLLLAKRRHLTLKWYAVIDRKDWNCCTTVTEPWTLCMFGARGTQGTRYHLEQNHKCTARATGDDAANGRRQTSKHDWMLLVCFYFLCRWSFLSLLEKHMSLCFRTSRMIENGDKRHAR